MRYSQFKIVEGYKEVTQKFSQEADPQAVRQMINKYRDLVNRNQVQGNERNIDWWSKQGWQNFEKFVTAKSQQPSQNQQKKRKAVGKSHTLAENNEWLIVVPLDKDASCFHGKGTDWCTTKPQHDHFEDYFRDSNVTLIYFLQKQTGKKWAIAVHESGLDEYFDINDKKISNSDMATQTGLPLETIMKYVNMVDDKSTEVSKKADASRNTMRREIDRLENMIDELRRSRSEERSPEIETLLLRTKSVDNLKRYMYAVANDEENPTEFDQNMQTLIALKLPYMMSNIANLTAKTVRLATEHSGNSMSFLGDIEKLHPDAVYDAFKNNPKSIPPSTKNVGKISPRLQKLFIEHDTLWIVSFGDDLDPRLAKQKAKALTSYFNKNPNVYAVVIEPGLTGLFYNEPLDKKTYQDASDTYGEESFEVITRDNLGSL